MEPPMRPRVSALPDLPDVAWLRILTFLTGYRRPYAPPRRGILFHAPSAFPLACASTRHFRLFRSCFRVVDATPSGDFLNPLARTDARFCVRDPIKLRAVVKLAASMLDSIHLPLYDYSMEDAHWFVLAAVAVNCPNLQTLSFVDSMQHRCRTPLSRQTFIFGALLRSVVNLRIFLVHQIPKIEVMISNDFFTPRSLTLHSIHPNVQTRLLDLLTSKGAQLQFLCLSFEETHPNMILPSFLQSLASISEQYLQNLSHLEVFRAPVRNPLEALQGPAITREQSIKNFDDVSEALTALKTTPARRKSFEKFVIDNVCPDISAVLRLFSHSCDHRTEIDVYLHEVLLVSPPKPEHGEMSLPYFRATTLHSSSWMISDLSASYFRRTEHIKISTDEDCHGSLIERMFPQDGTHINPDTRSFRFLCEQSGKNVQTVHASVHVESAGKANTVLRILSEGLTFARNVRYLEISSEVLRFVGLQHSQLYAVVGQLKKLVELYVCKPGYPHDPSTQIENLPLLLRALWMNCRELESFKFEFSSFGSASSADLLRKALDSLREFDRELPGVETHNLGEMLELSLSPQDSELAIE